ncbi:MAG: metal ABC transporter ATP-binding protein [Elusimicrobiota bacterium]|jgi:zinc transport system ATP-binding protein|nr:metal ABC transporter ATP-binding protein [Elusimicrobiota bacterium]
MNIIEAENLTFAYSSGAAALEDISFRVSKGDFTGVLGPNGSGKTTLIKLILGLLKPQRGEVKLFGCALKDFKEWHKIGYLEQKNTPPSIIPLTAFEAARMGLLSTKKTPKIFNARDNEITAAAMRTAGCYDYKDKLFYELSGGQQQRVLLARALANNPQLIILDEPSTALDSNARGSLFELLRGLNKNGAAVLVITHDIADIGKYVNKFMILDKHLIFHGSKADFCSSPQITKYFGPYTPHLMDHLHDAGGVCPLGGH